MVIRSRPNGKQAAGDALRAAVDALEQAVAENQALREALAWALLHIQREGGYMTHENQTRLRESLSLLAGLGSKR